MFFYMTVSDFDRSIWLYFPSFHHLIISVSLATSLFLPKIIPSQNASKIAKFLQLPIWTCGTGTFYQLEYFVRLVFISVKFPLEEVVKERDASVPPWYHLADEAQVWDGQGHLGEKNSPCLAWSYTEHKSQSGLYPSPHMQGVQKWIFDTILIFGELSEILTSFTVWKRV